MVNYEAEIKLVFLPFLGIFHICKSNQWRGSLSFHFLIPCLLPNSCVLFLSFLYGLYSCLYTCFSLPEFIQIFSLSSACDVSHLLGTFVKNMISPHDSKTASFLKLTLIQLSAIWLDSRPAEKRESWWEERAKDIKDGVFSFLDFFLTSWNVFQESLHEKWLDF